MARLLSFSPSQGGAGGDDNHFVVIRSLLKEGAASGHRQRYLLTGGCLDYGHCPGQIIGPSSHGQTQPLMLPPVGVKCSPVIPHLFSDESFPLRAVTGRVTFEKEVLAAADYDGCVVRPGFVYGTNFGHYMSPWYTSI